MFTGNPRKIELEKVKTDRNMPRVPRGTASRRQKKKLSPYIPPMIKKGTRAPMP
jgi:hypothetical protein